ncbi:MAG: hypothetical protein NC200_02550 [Candidatus Gastranaerophilales bacterium]|nr:hypothetical protein [Candidatus Gastranaerophilales bacterium]
MTYAFNPLDPMNHSMYLESMVPDSIDSAIATLPNYGPNPNSPRLRPQPTKDSWYYNKDGADDGHISTFEKLKAFAKGGTYNMIRGLFCDKDGFSFGRTLATAAGVAAVALTGPIGAAIAGGVGLVCAADNFAQSVRNAKYATTDQQAREAYEGFGESTTTAGLALFGGFKGYKAIKNNFAYAKNNNLKIKLKDKLMKWDVSKLHPIPVAPNGTGGTGGPAPNGGNQPNGGPAPSGGNQPNGSPTGGSPNPVNGGGNPSPSGSNNPPSGSPSGPTPNSGNIPRGTQPTGNNNPLGYEIDGSGYIPDWKPVGELPKPTAPEYFSPYEPIDPKLVNTRPNTSAQTSAAEYFSPYEPIDPKLVTTKPNGVSAPPPEIVTDTAPIAPEHINQPKPQYDFSYGQDNNHFFG